MNFDSQSGIIDKVARLLGHSPHDVNCDLISSEEAQVWQINHLIRLNSVTIEAKVVAWLKRHKSMAKAKREREAIYAWGKWVGAPKIIANLDEFTLLLEHCEGLSLSQVGPQAAPSIGSLIAHLHQRPYPDKDTLPLSQALSMRANHSLKSLSKICSRIEKDSPLLAERLHDLVMNAGLLFREAEEGIGEVQRVPCHRDLRTEHLIFNYGKKGALSIKLIDWGQSRADHWSSDWVKLWLDPTFEAYFDSAWDTYWLKMASCFSSTLSREQLKNLTDRSLRQLHSLATFHVLNTFIWADQMQTEVMIGSNNLSKSAIWKRGIDELEVLNKRSLF